jgi:hypothetical protein
LTEGCGGVNLSVIRKHYFTIRKIIGAAAARATG